jgi:hypothetical protein
MIRLLNFTGLDVTLSQKLAFVIAATTRTSNPATLTAVQGISR